MSTLRHLSLTNFRNHANFTADFSRQGAIITGANGAGKTSILEAICLLSSLRSFRTRKMDEVVLSGEDFCEVTAKTEAEAFTLRWQFTPRKKTVLRRNDVILSAPELLKRKGFFAVLFSPEELQLPFMPPRDRRKFMNRLLSPLFPAHLRDLRKLEKIVASRNALLKRIYDGLAKREEVEFYDQELATVSEQVTALRQKFFAESQTAFAKFYQTISGTSATLSIDFAPSITDAPLVTIQNEYAHDLARKATSRGAHHDDFHFFLDGVPLENCGSRGEVRSAILALKMAERDFVHQTTETEPVLLLDDVFSELDADRRRHLMEFISQRQCFITTTDTPTRAVKHIDLPVMRLDKLVNIMTI